MANRFLNNISINDQYTLPTSDGSANQVLATNGSGQLSFVDQTGGASETAERIEVTVKNVSGGSLSKGTVVHASPSANPPNGNVIEVIAADYDDSTKMPAIGILNETIANEGEGSAVMMGAVSGIDTSSFSIGDELYVGNLGTLTNSKPVTAGQLIQKIAVVIKSHASNGLIKIFGAGRSNDVPLPLYIDNTNQRVGIGDSTPSYTLDVNGTIYGSAVRSGRYYGISGTSSYLDLDSGAPYSLLASSEVNVTSSITCNDLTATETGGIAATNGPVYANRFHGNGNTTYYVDPNDSTTSAILAGKVGIGDTDPGAKLVVAQPQITSGGFSTPFIELKSTAQTDNTGLVAMSFSTSTADNYGYSIGALRGSSGGASSFVISHHDNSLTGSESMRIDSSGNVGIGTTSPDQTLDVAGNVTANRYYGNTSTAYYVDPNETGTAIYTAGDIRAASTKGFTSDGLGKLYAWRAVDNTLSNTTNYVKIATLTGTASGSDYFSDRCIIELAGRSTSYSNNQLPAMGYIVAQLQSDNDWDVVYYNHHNGSDEVVDEVGVVQTGYTTADIYVRVGSYAEVTASGHISDGHITVDNTRSGSAPSGYSAANAEYKVWNSGNDGSGSNLDADLLDGNHASAFASSSHTHAAGDITSGTFSTARIPNLAASKITSGTFSAARIAHNSFDIGDTTAETGRSVHETGIYTFNRNNGNLGTGTNTSYYSVLAYGQGAGGSAQIATEWTNGGNKLYFRSLRDTTDNWWSWKEIYHTGHKPTYSELGTMAYSNLTGTPTIPTNYLRDDAFDTGVGLYLTGGSYNAGTDTATAALVIDEEDFIYTKDGSYLRRLIGKTGDQIQIGHAGTGLISSINFLPGTAGNSAVKINSNTVWNAGNDGSGSGLDADLLDGQQGSYYDHRGYTIDNNYLGGYYVSGGIEKPNDAIFGSGKFKVAMLRGGSTNLGFGGTWNDVFWLSSYNGGDVKKSVALVSSKYDSTSLWIAKQDFDSSSWGTGYLFWNSGNDGSGSGLDADLLDGVQGSGYLRSDASDTFNGGLGGSLTVQGVLKVANSSATAQQISISAATSGNTGYISNGNGGTIFFGVPAANTTNIEVQGTAEAAVFRGRFNSNYYTDHEDTGDSIRVAGDIVAYYSSDKRYKENIKLIESPIEKVKAISGVTFEWNEKSHKETGKKDVGVIAQEVEEVLPEIVETRNNGYKAVDYQKLTAVLIEAVKDQQKQIDELKSIINGGS